MRKLFWFALFFTAGAALFLLLQRPLLGLILGCLCSLAALLFWLIKRIRSHPAWMALGLAVGLLWTTGYDLWIAAPVRALDGETERFTALLRDDLQSTDYGARVYVDAEIQGHRCRLLLYLDELPELRGGDRVEVTARLTLPKGEDYELYYRSIGIDLIAYAAPGAVPVPSGTLSAFPLRLRRSIKDKIHLLFPADAVAFMQALLIGDRTGLNFAEVNALNISGIAHTVVISGMHISILVGLILLLCGNRRWLCACIGIPVILTYTLLVGAMPSVVRAAVMEILLLLSPLLLRESDTLTSLGFAALCILVPNPWTAANLSFQLSFGAILGILLLGSPLYARICRLPRLKTALRRRGFGSLLRYIIGNATTTLGACLFTIPLIALQRGMVSLLGIVTNLLVSWAVTLAFQAGLGICLLGFVWQWPARLLAGAAAYLVRYILWVAQGITAFPLAAVYTDNLYMIIWLVFLYLIGLCMLLPHGRRLALPGACVAALGLCLCLWLGYLEGREFDATLLDVGQGQCLILRDGNVTAMYDCGGSGTENAGERAARFLLSKGIGRLDVLILSHYDTDHAGGVCQLLTRLPVSLLYLPELPCDTSLREEITAAALAQGTEIRYVTVDETLTFSESTLHIFAPTSQASENDASLALLFSQGSFDILATGDMTSQAEMRLLGQHTIPDLEVLIAGHHGAATSTSDTLLELTKPESVLISVGESNPYRHPSDVALSRIQSHGAEIFRTDLCGDITIRR